MERQTKKPNPVILYSPQPGPQTVFHSRLEDIVGYGGAKGPGKTEAIIGEATRQVQSPHYVGKIFRRTFPQLTEIIDRCHSKFPRVGAKWDGERKRYIFPSAAKIQFCHSQNERDVENHQGQECQFLGIDQVEQFTKYQVDYLMAQVRTSHPGLRCYSRFTFNAGGIGHKWVQDMFCRNKEPGETYDVRVPLPGGKVAVRTSTFIRGRVYDNKIMMETNPQYVATLAALPDKLRRAFLEGDMNVLEGQYFEEWGEDTHTINPFQIGKDWKIYMCLDWGYEQPLVCHWWGVPPGGKHIYCVREYKTNHKTSPVAAQEIHEICKAMFGDKTNGWDYIDNRAIECMYVDPSIYQVKGNAGKTIGEDFYDKLVSPTGKHLPIIRAENDRLAGWNVYRNMLAIQPDGLSFAMWFTTCRYAIESMPTLVYDSTRLEDLDTDGEDHAADADRYFFIMRFKSNAIPIPDRYAKLEQVDPMSAREWRAVDEKLRRKKEPDIPSIVANVGL